MVKANTINYIKIEKTKYSPTLNIILKYYNECSTKRMARVAVYRQNHITSAHAITLILVSSE